MMLHHSTTEIQKKMRRYYPEMKIIIVSLLIFTLCVSVLEAADSKDQNIPENVSAELVQQDLLSHNTAYLLQLSESPEKRLNYAKSLYVNQKLEQAVVEQDLYPEQRLLESMRINKSRILLETLMDYEFQQIDEDLEALAKERYDASPEIYRVRKKIKIALLLIEKSQGMEGQAKAEMDGIVAQLNADPENDQLFYELAEKHSDDAMAFQGGVNKKWLIAPLDLDKALPLLQASFALETPKQMTEIVETRQGYTIVRLLKVTPAYKLDYESAKVNIKNEIMSELQYRVRADVMARFQVPAEFQFDDEAVTKIILELRDKRLAEGPKR